MIQQAYAYFSTLCTPLWRFLLKRRMQRGKEDPQRLPERWGMASHPRPEGKVVWIHAASIGESLSTLGLIAALQQAFPQVAILITTGTRTSAGILKQRLPAHVIHQMVPLDIPASVRRFLDFWKPSLGLFMEADLWPNLLFQTQQRAIPTLLLNGRLSDKSLRRWKWGRWLISPLIKNFTLCLVASALQAQRLTSLGAAHVKITGNLKFTTPPLTCAAQEWQRLKEALGKRPVWLAASTHPGEEQLILEAHHHLRVSFPSLLLILVPRHLHRVKDICALVEKEPLTVQLYSDEKEGKKGFSLTCDVFVGDTLGDLGLFYRLSPLAFIGGSFVPVGGHNLIEPAQLGCAVLHGPLMENNQDIAAAFKHATAAYEVDSPEKLAEKVKLLLKSPQKRHELIEKATSLVASQQKVLEEVTSLLQHWMKA